MTAAALQPTAFVSERTPPWVFEVALRRRPCFLSKASEGAW